MATDAMDRCPPPRVPPAVPRELCSQIAQLSLRHFALANALASLNARSTRPVRISKSIWARYTLFEGIWYIASMSTKASSGATHDDNILVVSESEPSTVFVAEDHLGIRGLLEGGAGVTSTVKSHRGIWWRMAQVPSLTTRLQTQTDVSCSPYPSRVFEPDTHARTHTHSL